MGKEISREYLKYLYQTRKMSVEKVSKYTKRKPSYIRRRLKDYHIKPGPTGQRLLANKSLTYRNLYRLYVIKGLTLKQMERFIRVDEETIRKRLHRLKIPVRPKATPKFVISKKYLISEYIKRKKSYKQIANDLGCGETVVYNAIKAYGIPARPRSESLKGRIFSLETRELMSRVRRNKHTGSANARWKGGISYKRSAWRRIAIYQRWRSHILRLKGQECAKCGEDLRKPCSKCGHRPDRHVHHIKSYAGNPKLRYSYDNAMVLCENCHNKMHHRKLAKGKK